MKDIYKDIYDKDAVVYPSDLYAKIVGDKEQLALKEKCLELGMNVVDAAIATDEQYAYFIGLKLGLIS